MNKYVGYQSDHLSVTIDKTVARLKTLKKVPNSEKIEKEKFKLVIDRFHGKVALHSYASISANSAMK